MRKDRKLEKIAAAFAEAVSEGDLREAEGWLAVARLCASREPDSPRPDPQPQTTFAAEEDRAEH